MQQDDFICEVPCGVVLAVRLTPRSGSDRINGETRDSSGKTWLSVRVKAVPEKGRANDALIRLLAKKLGRPARSLDIIQGAASRNKRIAVNDMDGEAVRAALKQP